MPPAPHVNVEEPVFGLSVLFSVTFIPTAVETTGAEHALLLHARVVAPHVAGVTDAVQPIDVPPPDPLHVHAQDAPPETLVGVPAEHRPEEGAVGNVP